MPDLSPQETNALRSLLNSLCPSLGLALAEQVNRDVLIEMLDVDATPQAVLLGLSDVLLHTTFNLSQPTTAESVFYVSESTASILADLIDGKEGLNPPINITDAMVEKLSSAMTGMARGLVTSLGNMRAEAIELEASSSHLGTLALPPPFAMEANAVRARMTLSIPDVTDAELTFLFTPEFVRALIPEVDESDLGDTGSILSEDELAAMLGEIGGGSSAPSAPAPAPSFGGGGGGAIPSFGGGGSSAAGNDPILPRGMELILDIPLDVTVELGRVRMLIKDVLELASGSIVELDRVAGEPVDLLVNGRLVAKGEVVVIEDNFGIRITEIISPADRVAGLGKGR